MATFDHNTAWQHESVAQTYSDRRFQSLAGRAFDYCEKRTLTRLLRRAERPHGLTSVLEAASGTGRISEFLLERGYHVTCGDISNEMMEVARRRLSGKYDGMYQFQTLNVYDLDYMPNSFDCVVCIRLFQHLTFDERTAALKELARVSKRYVIINVMYTSWYYELIRRARLALKRYAPRYTCSKEQLNESLAQSQLQLVQAALPQPGYNGNLMLLLEKRDDQQS